MGCGLWLAQRGAPRRFSAAIAANTFALMRAPSSGSADAVWGRFEGLLRGRDPALGLAIGLASTRLETAAKGLVG